MCHYEQNDLDWQCTSTASTHLPHERLGTNWKDPQGLWDCSTSRSASVWCSDLRMCLAQAAPRFIFSVQVMVFLCQKGMIMGHWGINWTMLMWCETVQKRTCKMEGQCYVWVILKRGYVSTSVNYCISMYTGFWNLKSKWTVMYCTLHTAHN